MKDYVVCLPVEVSRRELLSKIYVGVKAVKAGYPALVGEHQSKVFGKVKSGFFLYKDHAPWSDNRYLSVKNIQGINFACLDEEGLIYISKEKYLNTRCSEKILKGSDVVFCWGEKQKNLIELYANNAIVVGNPRFDLARLLSKQVKKNDGQKISILINTRFPACNPLRGNRELENLKGLSVIKTKEDELKYYDFVNQDRQVFEEFIELISMLSKRSDFEIIIRPHPNESLDPYKAIGAELGIKVDNHTELLRQIKNCDVVIHDGCTTAIEAKAAGKMVLGLRPSSVSYDYGYFANQFSCNFNSALSLFSFLINIDFEFYNKQVFIDDSAASEFLANWNENESFSTNKILSCIEYFSNKSSQINDLGAIRKSGDDFKYKFKKIIFKSNYLLKRLPFGVGFSNLIDEISISQYKFPPLSLSDVSDSISFLKEIDTDLPEVSITMLGEKSFLLESVG